MEIPRNLAISNRGRIDGEVSPRILRDTGVGSVPSSLLPSSLDASQCVRELNDLTKLKLFSGGEWSPRQRPKPFPRRFSLLLNVSKRDIIALRNCLMIVIPFSDRGWISRQPLLPRSPVQMRLPVHTRHCPAKESKNCLMILIFIPSSEMTFFRKGMDSSAASPAIEGCREPPRTE